jgi:hypothetical protein
MTKTMVPEVGEGGEVGLGHGRDGVEAIGAIKPENHASGLQVLDKKTKHVKFDSAIVVTSKLVN